MTDRMDKLAALVDRVDTLQRGLDVLASSRTADIDTLRAELEAMREEIVSLQRSRDEQRGAQGAIEARLAGVEVQVGRIEGKLTDVVNHQGEQDTTLARISAKVGKGALAGAGVPSAVVIVVELARQLGWLPATLGQG